MVLRMGRIRDALTMTRYADAVEAAYRDPTTLPMASPWAGPSGLSQVVYRDIFGDGSVANTRGSAMRIPSVRRARNLLVSTISRLPLVQLGLGEEVPYVEDFANRDAYVAALLRFQESQPTWMYRSDDGASPQHRMAWTIDDLIFHPASLWQCTRGSDRRVLAAQRVNFDRWSINDDNRVEIDGDVKSDDEVILIPGLSDGILVDGVDVLRDARQLNNIVRKRLKNPVPAIDLHQTGGTPLNATERAAMVKEWGEARDGEHGGVAYTNQWIEAKEMGGQLDGQMMIDARNAASVDVARLLGVAASRIDASGVNSTLSYETTTGRNQELVDFDLAFYTLPVLARLSMDDCVVRGKRTAFDLSDLTRAIPSVTGAKVAD